MFDFFSARINVLCLCFLSVGAMASTFDRTFTPQVMILKKSSHSLEIDMKPSFMAVYSSFLGSFLPVSVPITVRSVDKSLMSYRIKLQTSQHYCRDKGLEGVALPDLVTTKLDGNAFSSLDSGKEGHDGLLVIDSSESKHVMDVSFSTLPQKEAVQECYGTFILIAEATAI